MRMMKSIIKRVAIPSTFFSIAIILFCVSRPAANAQSRPQSSIASTTPADAGSNAAITGIRVNGPARQVGSSDTWGVAKGVGEVTLSVTVDPPDAANLVSWSEGSPVADHPEKHTISIAKADHKSITATLGKSPTRMELWIFWASVSVHTTGRADPANHACLDLPNLRSGRSGDLGAFKDETDKINTGEAAGNVEIEAILEPKGVGAVLTGGWRIKQFATVDYYEDGTKRSVNQSDAVDATSSAAQFRPDEQDRIFLLDAPTLDPGFSFVLRKSPDADPPIPGIRTCEMYANFSNWVIWNNLQCSDSAKGKWHFYAAVDDELDRNNPRYLAGLFNKDTAVLDLAVGNVALPAASQFVHQH